MTPPERNDEHESVGAYALGVLDPDDASRFEEHLAGCDACAERLEGFLRLEPLLAQLAEAPETGLDRDALVSVEPGPRLLPRVLDEVADRRRRQRRRGRLLAAAAAVLVVGGPFATVVATDPGPRERPEPRPSATVTRSPEEVFFVRYHTVQGTDPDTGVSAIVGTRTRSWGTDTVLQLRNVRGPRKCNLIAVSRTGEEEVVTSWAVPRLGYGMAGRGPEPVAQPLYIRGGAAMPREDIDHFEVRTFDGEKLVSVDA